MMRVGDAGCLKLYTHSTTQLKAEGGFLAHLVAAEVVGLMRQFRTLARPDVP